MGVGGDAAGAEGGMEGGDAACEGRHVEPCWPLDVSVL